MGLTAFLEKEKVCIGTFPAKGIRYIFSMSISPLNRNQLDNLSYVEFGDDGNLSVFISEMDYKLP